MFETIVQNIVTIIPRKHGCTYRHDITQITLGQKKKNEIKYQTMKKSNKHLTFLK